MILEPKIELLNDFIYKTSHTFKLMLMLVNKKVTPESS